MGSILKETKSALGLDPEAEGFDPELILHINSVLGDFTQLGIGPDGGFAITGATETWANFIGTDARFNMARSLLFLQVKMLFDSGNMTGPIIAAYQRMIEKEEWRLNIARESIVHPPVIEVIEEDMVLDGGEI